MRFNEQMVKFLEEVCYDRDMDYMNDPRPTMKSRLDEAKEVYKKFCKKSHIEPDVNVLTL